MGMFGKIRSKRPKKVRENSKGLRIQLKGKNKLADLRNMLIEAVQRLDELGITHASGINLYISPVDKDGKPVTPLTNGRPVSLIVVEPYRSAAEEHGL